MEIMQVSASDHLIILRIAERAVPMASRANVTADFQYWVKHISRCHTIAAPLDLEALYTAPDEEFARDVFGIRAYMHESGQWFTDWRPALARGENGRFNPYM